MSEADVHGPIDAVLLEFPGDRFTGELSAELARLIDAGIVRLYDVVVIRKDPDGTFSGIALDSVDGDQVAGLTTFAGARSGLIGDEDLATAAEAMAPGTTAALIVYENSWSIPFVAAALRAGGEMVASMRIPAQDVMDALADLEAND